MEVGSRVGRGRPGRGTGSAVRRALRTHNGPTESGTEMRTPKQAIRADCLAPPFTIEGEISFSAYEAELHQEPRRARGTVYPGDTSPLLGPTAWPNRPTTIDLLVLRHDRAHVAVAGRPPSGARRRPWTRAPGGGSNPWSWRRGVASLGLRRAHICGPSGRHYGQPRPDRSCASADVPD